MTRQDGNRRGRVVRRDFVLAWVIYAVFVLALVSASLADGTGGPNGERIPFPPVTAPSGADTGSLAL